MNKPYVLALEDPLTAPDPTGRRGQQMKALRFEQLVEQIVRRKQPDWKIETEKRLSASVLLDLYAESPTGEIYLVEIKYASPHTSRRIREAAAKLNEAAEALDQPAARVQKILAFAGTLSSRYRHSLEEGGFTLWDAALLREWVEGYPELAAEADNLLETERIYSTGPTRVPDPTLLPCGKANWPEYQRSVSEVFEYLFCPPLNTPFIENSNEGGFKRRDIVVPNYCDSGFWNYLARRYVADHIIVDAKNYCGNIGKDQILQVANYLTEGGPGLFGLIVTRKGLDTGGRYLCREQWMLHRKMVIVVNDSDILQMVETKLSGGAPEELIRQKIEDFRLAI